MSTPRAWSGSRVIVHDEGSALAQTLSLIAEGGAEEFYRGDLGRRVVRGGRAAGSPLDREAFATHQADWVEPLRVPYRTGQAASLPPPTQGVAALAILAILDGFGMAWLDEADYVHVIVEATKLAFADRDRYLADPTVVPVAIERCLDPASLAARCRQISRRTALPVEPPDVAGDTVAVVIADGQGNAVVVIQSLYWEFGAAVVAGDTGVLLQNRGAFFSLDPAHPNCLAPRKRPGHTLIPSMYLVGGRPRLAYRTMGGEGQPQTQAASLGERGHDIRLVEDWSDLVGHAQLIRLHEGGLTGGSDPRADGAAVGW